MEQSISKTNANNSSWRRKSNSLDLVDRISTLPYSILGNILSFLPTKNAVSTAVLSKRWKLVWTTVHNLDLCYEDSMGKQDETGDMRFVGFVNRVLLDHDAGWLNKFCLVWTPRCISSHASSWISTGISKNVHHLILRLETHTLVVTDFSRQRTSPEPFVMPICVFSCNSLRCLELNGGISISESIVVCLPGLETLRLKSVYLRSQKAFENLIRGCPMLSDLFILMPSDMLPDFIQDVDFTYVISSTSLRRFEFNFEYFNDPDFYINLELDTCSLEYLTLEGFIPVFLGQKSLSSLIEAKLTIDMLECNFSKGDMCNSIVEAVRVFDSAKALILSAGVIWALSFATDSLSTEFKRLVKLETKTYYCYWSSVGDFIRCSDNLEVITMDQQNTSLKNDFDHTSWTPPVEVPRCLFVIIVVERRSVN